MNPRAREIKTIPPMETGAPMPAIKEIGSDFYLSYICNNPDFPGRDLCASPDHPGFDEYCAVIKFCDVAWYHFGGPNDENLHEHPLYGHGLTFYGFHSVENSTRLNSTNQSHWIFTFHDETLEVVAVNLEVVSVRVNTALPEKAITLISEPSLSTDRALTQRKWTLKPNDRRCPTSSPLGVENAKANCTVFLCYFVIAGC